MSFQKALIIGSTGTLGQAFTRKCKEQNIEFIGLSRKNNDYNVDLREDGAVSKVIKDSKPELVVNCSAIVSLLECEKDKYSASKVNHKVVTEIASTCSAKNIKFVQISTDHYYTKDKNKLHSETDEIHILNNYAKTKRGGEIEALNFSDSLVIRTNITGIRGISSKPTFFEWAYKTLISKQELKVFTDFFTSTIDSDTFADLTLAAASLDVNGLLNISSSDCISKKEFIFSLAKSINVEPSWAIDASVKEIKPVRAESLGLDSSKAEKILKVKMPSSKIVIQNLIKSLEQQQ